MNEQHKPACSSNSTELTLDFYKRNADSFAASTVGVEFSSMQDRFTALLAPGASILDFGCGSGRDAKHFLEQGFDVTATDGSPELCALASSYAGIPVRNELFQDLADVAAYDGIWACSSILHLPKSELLVVLAKMDTALKPGGVIYTSFKYGDFEGLRNGRYFTDFTEPAFREFLGAFPNLTIQDLWITGDARPGRESEKWLNLLIKKA